MPFMPFNILGMWFRGWLSIAILVGAAYAIRAWYESSRVVETPRSIAAAEEIGRNPAERVQARDLVPSSPAPRVFRFRPGWNRPTAWLAAGVALLAWGTVGRWIGMGASMVLGGPEPKGAAVVGDEPRQERGGESHRIKRKDGTEIHVETYGPADAPPIVFTHGWGANATEWFYPKKNLAGRFRLILWDEPGLGLSRKPDDNNYHLEKMAADLEAVLAFAGDKPAVLVGHSIGGMITLTFCKVFPEALRARVAGLVLVHTTYTNPVRTSSMPALYTALEKPVLIPLMHLTIGLWPLVWLMNGLSFLNGSAHRSTHKESFSGKERYEQLDFCARFMPQGRPDVLARGMLGMIAYDASATLASIGVPTLVVVGDLDKTTPAEAGRHIARTVPGATLATLSPAKHMGLIEHHDEFDRLVGDFAGACLKSKSTVVA